MEFTAAFVNPPKEGKVLANVKTDKGDLIGFDPKKFTFQQGKRYDCTVSENEYKGKVYLRVESQKEVGGAPSGNGSAGGSDRFWLAFVSNQVAHAIAAGAIKEPQDMKMWALAAKDAVQACDEQQVNPDF